MKFSPLILLAVFLVSCGDSSTSTPQPVAPVSRGAVETAQKPSSQPVVRAQERSSTVDKKIPLGEITGVDMGRVFNMTQTGQILLVDCRPPLFYRMGHIDGAVNLPLKSYATAVQKQKPNLDRARAAEQVIVLYCQNLKCPDAYAVAKKLVTLGYSVSIYKGGWEEWKRAGF